MKIAIAALVLLTLTATAATAEIVNVSIIGTVEYNAVRSGRFASVRAGDAAAFTFSVDSNNFVNSASYPTRGYVIDQASFLVTLGSTSAVLYSPFAGTPYFVIRNNDPAVDGFFLSLGTDLPSGLTIDAPANVAGTRFFEARFNVTYEGTRLSSLDIMGALGTYDYTGLSVFGFAIDDLGNDPIGINFAQLMISAPVPAENTTWGGLKALYD